MLGKEGTNTNIMNTEWDCGGNVYVSHPRKVTERVWIYKIYNSSPRSDRRNPHNVLGVDSHTSGAGSI